MSRNRLHKSKLGAFREWLIEQGWEPREIKGPYEVLRMYWGGNRLRKGFSYWLIVHHPSHEVEHYTLHAQSEAWFSKWQRTLRQAEPQFQAGGMR